MDEIGTIGPAGDVAVVRRLFDEGFARGNPAVVDQVCSPDLIEHQFGLAGTGQDAIGHVKAAIVDVHAAFPDVAFTVEHVARSGDLLWVLVRGSATGAGPFFGPPSGRQVDFTVIDVCRMAGGRIVEHWGVPDRFALLAQTGVLDRLAPAPGPAPAVEPAPGAAPVPG